VHHETGGSRCGLGKIRDHSVRKGISHMNSALKNVDEVSNEMGDKTGKQEKKNNNLREETKIV
jgi:hypothetical protein